MLFGAVGAMKSSSMVELTYNHKVDLMITFETRIGGSREDDLIIKNLVITNEICWCKPPKMECV